MLVLTDNRECLFFGVLTNSTGVDKDKVSVIRRSNLAILQTDIVKHKVFIKSCSDTLTPNSIFSKPVHLVSIAVWDFLICWCTKTSQKAEVLYMSCTFAATCTYEVIHNLW